MFFLLVRAMSRHITVWTKPEIRVISCSGAASNFEHWFVARIHPREGRQARWIINCGR